MDINTGTKAEGLSEEKGVRKPYHSPELVNLGQIQSLVQSGNFSGNDGNTCNNGCANS
jgi:hypothetical protein